MGNKKKRGTVISINRRKKKGFWWQRQRKEKNSLECQKAKGRTKHNDGHHYSRLRRGEGAKPGVSGRCDRERNAWRRLGIWQRRIGLWRLGKEKKKGKGFV